MPAQVAVVSRNRVVLPATRVCKRSRVRIFDVRNLWRAGENLLDRIGALNVDAPMSFEPGARDRPAPAVPLRCACSPRHSSPRTAPRFAPAWSGSRATAGFEDQVCRVLEGLGAIELAHLDDCAVTPGARHRLRRRARRRCPRAVCVHARYAVPQLRALGWRVEIDPDYPWQVVGGDAPLYAAALPDRERPDWFGLELGVEVDGQRVDLLPALLDMLDSAGDLAALTRSRAPLHRGAGRRQALAAGAAGAPEAAREGAASSSIATAARSRAPAVRAPLVVELCATLHDGAAAAALGRRSRRSASRRTRSRSVRGRRSASTAPPRACAPSCGRTSAKASRGSSTCASTVPAASSPTTWGSARRCRRSRTS